MSSSSSSAADECDGATAISWCAEATKSQENPRPPLVRTSRGRVQVLPSRFNDSVLANWKKVKSNGKNVVKDSAGDSEYLPIKKKNYKLVFRTSEIRGHVAVNKKRKEDKIANQCRKFSPLSEDEIEDLRSNRLRSYNFRKYSSLYEGWEDEEELVELMEFYGMTSYCFEDFDEGDVVWAISGKKRPPWPAIVLSLFSQVPQQVLNFRVAGAVCMMFFGYSGNGTQREYAWIKPGMIFPFVDCVDMFQGQTDLNDRKPGNLRSAIAEAFLPENGFSEMLMIELNAASGNTDYIRSVAGGVCGTSDANHNQGCNLAKQDAFMKREIKSCEACGMSITPNSRRSMDSAVVTNRLCISCAKLKIRKHYCGICKKIRNQADNGTWCGVMAVNFGSMQNVTNFQKTISRI